MPGHSARLVGVGTYSLPSTRFGSAPAPRLELGPAAFPADLRVRARVNAAVAAAAAVTRQRQLSWFAAAEWRRREEHPAAAALAVTPLTHASC